MQLQKLICVFLGAILLVAVVKAQDYDDEGYGNQGNNGNQGDNDGYGSSYNNDDGYSGNMPNYQQNVDSDGSNNNPSTYSNNGNGGSDADGDYEGDDGTAAASSIVPSVVRVRRSVGEATGTPVASSVIKNVDQMEHSSSEPKLRVKRHGKYYIGPVYTYVKTDKHANFKWGVSR